MSVWNRLINDSQLHHYIKDMKMNDREISAVMGFCTSTIARNRRRLRMRQPKKKIGETSNWDKKTTPNQKRFDWAMQGVWYG
jgi:hypothetical protein